MMQFNKKLILGIALFCYLLTSEVFGINLKGAVKTALETNPSISADEAAERASAHDIDVARSGYFPSLDIVQSSVGYQRTYINNKFDPPLSFPQKGHATRKVTNPTVLFSQTLFDGFATPFAVARAHRLADTAHSTLEQTTEQIALDAIAAYVNYLAQQRLFLTAEENIKRHEDILEKVKKRVDGGISTIADVYQVQSRLEAARVLKEKIEGQLEVAEADYIAVVGIPPEDLKEYELPEAPISCGADGVLSRIFKNNPAVVVAYDKLRVAKAVLDETISPFLPNVSAQLESNAPVLNANGVKGKQNTYTAQMVLNYNLLNGGKDVANRAAQIERVVEAKKRLAAARRNGGKIGRAAWARYFSAVRQAEGLEKDVIINKKLSRAYEIQFALVARPLIDLLDAYVSYYRSENDLINAEADRDTNHALLLAAMGDLVSYIVPEAVNKCNEGTDADYQDDSLCEVPIPEGTE